MQPSSILAPARNSGPLPAEFRSPKMGPGVSFVKKKLNAGDSLGLIYMYMIILLPSTAACNLLRSGPL